MTASGDGIQAAAGTYRRAQGGEFTPEGEKRNLVLASMFLKNRADDSSPEPFSGDEPDEFARFCDA